jgi:2,3-dihydroxybenzoate-AMP ligase
MHLIPAVLSNGTGPQLMKPSLLSPEDIQSFLATRVWSEETTLDCYRRHAQERPMALAVRDANYAYTWSELDAVTDRLAASLVSLGLDRDSRALVQMPSSSREVVLRIAFKKAGLIGAFAPLQWRRRELEYVRERIEPALVVMSPASMEAEDKAWLDVVLKDGSIHQCIDLDDSGGGMWIDWSALFDNAAECDLVGQLSRREFRYDEVSLLTLSSGTSGLAKLCEWPEAAQVLMGTVLAERMDISDEDDIGIFAPMTGAAGLVVWMISAAVACACTFPPSYRGADLLDCVEQHNLTAATTVPVILARLVREPLESRGLGRLRFIRIGTGAPDMEMARDFEVRTGCRVVVASGSMECTGFGHAAVCEDISVRLNGSVGLPLRTGELRIEDENGNKLSAGTSGELKARAPFGSSGYWRDSAATAKAWKNGWYSTGDIGVIDDSGRLTLMGRLKFVINRSGLKILPIEVELAISTNPEVMDCAVVAGPDPAYGEVPVAFVQMHEGFVLEDLNLNDRLRRAGFPDYKIPVRIIAIEALPRISDNKIDRQALMKLASE